MKVEPIVYGMNLWTRHHTATANVQGGFAYAEDVMLVLPAGVQTLTATFHPLDWQNYERAKETFDPADAGARKAIAVLRAGRRLGMLVDQKANDGIAVPFFGRDAMTPPALAQFALRFGCTVTPVRMERLDGCRFRVTFYPALDLPASGDRHADLAEAMRRVNAMLEGWIRERPAQWLWLHRRWPDS